MTAVPSWCPGAMRRGADFTGNGLRHLLNEWDPIGAADEVQDEYDCMLAPLLQLAARLMSWATAAGQADGVGSG
jgi:hypothetical protein